MSGSVTDAANTTPTTSPDEESSGPPELPGRTRPRKENTDRITLPSSLDDFESPQTSGDVERYMRSASSDARSRVALMRLAWDFIGSEFGSRHQQYEKFYGGASFLVKQNLYRNFDFARAGALVDAALGLPPVEAG